MQWARTSDTETASEYDSCAIERRPHTETGVIAAMLRLHPLPIVIPSKAIVKPAFQATAIGGYGLDNSLGRNGSSAMGCKDNCR